MLLAGCDSVLGLAPVNTTPDAAPDAAVLRVTGDYHHLIATVGTDLAAVQTEVPAPPDTELDALLPDGTPVSLDRGDDGSFTFEVPLGEFERFRKQHPHAGERIMRNLAQLLADRLILANAKVNLLTSS